jgi:hypothetical protein
MDTHTGQGGFRTVHDDARAANGEQLAVAQFAADSVPFDAVTDPAGGARAVQPEPFDEYA